MSPPSGRKRKGPPRLAGEDLLTWRRRQIVQTAFDVFAEKGYTAASVPEIAKRLGLSQGSFYRYFQSKRDVLDAVFDSVVEQLTAAVQLETTPDSADSLEELESQLRAMTQRAVDQLEAQPGVVQLVLLEATAIDDAMTQRLVGLVDRTATLAQAYIDNGVAKGFIRPLVDTRAVGQAILVLAVPALLQVLRGDFPAKQRERYVDALVDFAVAGLR